MARSSWRVWTESITGRMLGVPLAFYDHSQALAQAVKLYRDGDSGQTVRAFVCSDTGTQAAKRRSVMFLDDTGRPQQFYGDQQDVIENILGGIERAEITKESEHSVPSVRRPGMEET